MKSTYKLIWTEEALNGLKGIFNYLESKFSENDIRKFTSKLDQQLEILKTNPKAFPIINKPKQIRRAIIAKLTSIYYRIDEQEIKIISIFDNRQNPEKLKI